jgi:hypothetical protein
MARTFSVDTRVAPTSLLARAMVYLQGTQTSCHHFPDA